MVERKILLNPGPATTTDTVKQAQIIPDICPREREFGDLMESIAKDLIKIARNGENDENYVCVLFGGSGTAAMDSVLNSVVPENGKILIINNGAYGERLVKIAKTYKLQHREIFFNWDEEIDVERIKQELQQEQDITHIAMIHHETTTGILNPIKKIGELAKKHNCVFVVDTISSFAGISFDIKECNIDFIMSASNKCIQGMPGVCFIICKKEELEKTRDYPKRSFYLNLYDQYEYFIKKHQMRFTPPIQTLYALKKAINEFFEETKEDKEARYERYKENHDVLIKGMQELGFKKIYDGITESNILTTFWEPEDPNYNFEKMHDILYRKGFTIYPGKIKEKTFRLANMGAINRQDIQNFLCAMKEALKEMNLNLK